MTTSTRLVNGRIDADAALRAFGALEEMRGPTLRELQCALGLSSTSVAHYRLRELRDRGFVEPIGLDEARGYRLTDSGRAHLASLVAEGSE